MRPQVRKCSYYSQSKRGSPGILLGREKTSRADTEIDKKKADGSYELTEAERKRRKDSGRQMAMNT